MAETPNMPTTEVLELLVVSKSILDRVRSQTPSNPDRYSVAMNILLSHDAAELAISAIVLDGVKSGVM